MFTFLGELKYVSTIRVILLKFFFFPLTPLAAHSRNTDFRFSLPILLFLPSFESDHLFMVVDFLRCLLGAVHQRRFEGVSSSPGSRGILLHTCAHTRSRAHTEVFPGFLIIRRDILHARMWSLLEVARLVWAQRSWDAHVRLRKERCVINSDTRPVMCRDTPGSQPAPGK